MKITAIIPTLNEEVHIEDSIKSVDFADEIIVIDSFSQDSTVEIAEKYNVKIIQRIFDDFSSQKNFAIDLAKNDWIYILDADERVTPELKKEILNIDETSTKFVGFYLRRNFYLGDKQIKYTGCQRDKVIRLFVKVSVGTMVKRFMKLLRLMELLVFLKIKLTIFRIEILIIT